MITRSVLIIVIVVLAIIGVVLFAIAKKMGRTRKAKEEEPGKPEE